MLLVLEFWFVWGKRGHVTSSDSGAPTQSILFRPVPPEGTSRERKGNLCGRRRQRWLTGWLGGLSTRPCPLSVTVGRSRNKQGGSVTYAILQNEKNFESQKKKKKDINHKKPIATKFSGTDSRGFNKNVICIINHSSMSISLNECQKYYLQQHDLTGLEYIIWKMNT